MRPLGMLAAAALVLGACAAQEEPLTVAEVNVSTDLSAVNSREAVAFWTNLDADLETAIASEFVGRIGSPGLTINVDVDELTLTNAFASGLAADDARLSGRVEARNPDGTMHSAYTVTATAQDAVTFLPAGTDVVTVPPSSAAFYSAVVQAFARGAAEVVTQGA